MARSRKRRGMRIPIRHPVFFETLDHRGAGTLIEVSYSGARVAVDGVRLVRGEKVRLYVWPPRQEEPFELAGTVANVRSDGFAIEYERAGQEICQWIDALQVAVGGEPAAEPTEGAA